MKLIPLTKGYFAQVDDEDYDRVSQFVWHAKKDKKKVYAARNTSREGRRVTERLHQFILQTGPEIEIHHKNGDGLDDQKQNLQRVTEALHSQLEYRRKDSNTSGFRGVYFHKKNNRWCAGIKNEYVGSYDTPVEAAKARDLVARSLEWPEESMNFPI